MRATTPGWVLEELNELTDATVGFEEDSPVEEDVEAKRFNQEEALQEYVEHDLVKEFDDVKLIRGENQEQILLQSIGIAKEEWNKLKKIKTEPKEEVEDKRGVSVPMVKEEDRNQGITEQGVYVMRSGQVSQPPNQLIESAYAYAVIREIHRNNFKEEVDNVEKQIVECTYAMKKALLFHNAMNTRPIEAMKALKEEVMKAKKINIWHPVHIQDLTKEQQSLIIPQMINYLEKYNPDATFDKVKVRVLTRGDKQIYTGVSEGPVARIESLFMLLSIAIFEDYAIFKVDVGSAFMRTPMADDVKHKWIKLDKRVIEILVELDKDEHAKYVLADGLMIVEMNKLSYGYVEAAHYWYKDLVKTFYQNNYRICGKDKCIFIFKKDNKVVYCGTTVDDCLFVCTRDEKWMQKQIEMLKNKYEEVTVEISDLIGLIGMHINMDCEGKKVVITQPKHMKRVIETFRVEKGAPMPALIKLMGDELDSPLLKDQSEYMSKCAMLMFLSQRTYPEIHPVMIKLSTKYNKAPEADM
jgi:hypothetical protein